jgi:hypothetical protein
MDQIELGKRWVEEIIIKYAGEYELPIEKLEWGESSKDFDRGVLSLAYYVNQERYIEKFSEENLSDCEGSPEVKKALEDRVKRFTKTKSAESEKRIGFKTE